MREQAVRWLLPLYIIVLVCGLCLSIFFFLAVKFNILSLLFLNVLR